MEDAMEREQRVPLSVRVSPELRDQIEKAAQQSGRSLTQETEIRLQASFAADRHLMDALDLAFGRQLAGLLTLLAHVMRQAGRSAGFRSTNTLDGAEDWMLNAYASDQAIAAANTVLEAVRPEGDASPPATAAYSQFPGLDFDPVVPYLVAVAYPGSGISDNMKRIGAEVREKLGDAVADRIARNIGPEQRAPDA
jgi:uncharacterized protein (DUF1778 family)